MSVVEGWASLDAWDGDTDLFSTAGGRLLPRGGDGTLPIITRSLRLPAGRRFRLVGSLSRTARGWGLIGVEGTEDTWAIGVNDDPGEIIGVRLSDFWQPDLGLELDIGDEVSIAIVGDELGVSFAVTTDDARIATMWQPWSEIGDVEAIWIVAGDPDAAMWIGPLGVDDTGATIAPRDGIEGLRPTAIEVRTSPEAVAAGERAIVMLPATFDSRAPSALAVVHCHGATQDAHEIFGGGTIATRPVAEAMLAQGWIVCGGDFAGDSFGNPAAVRWVNELAVWLDGHLPIRARALTSDSMGGLVALNTIASRIHDWAGWVGWEPATNLHSDDPDWWATSSVGEWMGGQFRAAYGIAADWSDLAERAGPHDPIRRRPEAYAGLQAALWASHSDGVADRADNADAFAAHIADVADVTVHDAVGDHNDPSHYQPAAVVTFLQNVLAPTGPTVWLHTGDGLARCVVRDHTGTPAVLHTGD